MMGAQFEIRIDGTPRTYRDRKDYAMEAARQRKLSVHGERRWVCLGELAGTLGAVLRTTGKP